MVRAVIVRCVKPTRRADGSYVRFDSNAAVIIDNDKNPQGNADFRRRGPRAARAQLHEDREPGQRGGLMLIRANDTVEVMTGDDRGHPGEGAPHRPHRRQAGGGRRQSRVQARPQEPAQSAGRPAIQGDAGPICPTCCWCAQPAARPRAWAPVSWPTAARNVTARSAGPATARFRRQGPPRKEVARSCTAAAQDPKRRVQRSLTSRWQACQGLPGQGQGQRQGRTSCQGREGPKGKSSRAKRP